MAAGLGLRVLVRDRTDGEPVMTKIEGPRWAVTEREHAPSKRQRKPEFEKDGARNMYANITGPLGC